MSDLKIVNKTEEDEKRFDLVAARNLENPASTFATIAYIIKGALGSGILASHVAFANGGLLAIPLTACIGAYMCSCLILLVKSAQIIYKRTTVTSMTYSDVVEAAFTVSSSACLRKISKAARYFVDACIILELFGACCCYQLMISGTIKQIVENTQNTSQKGLTPKHPNLRIYMLIMLTPIVLLCLLRHMTWLAKISIVGNFIVLLCVFTTIYYSLKANPSMKGMKPVTSVKGIFTFTGLSVFSMSCAGIVVSLETNMSHPSRFALALAIGMTCITSCVITMGFFGYSAYGEDAKAPITFHFPMAIYPIILKAGIAIMLFITHAANFWVPFNLLFHYLKKCHKSRLIMWEYIYRAICVCFICGLGIVFPSVNKLMSFLGAFCLSNMAFIFPALVYMATIWDRPGFGVFKWRLIMVICIILVGLVLFSAGTYVSVGDLVALFGATEEKIDEVDQHVFLDPEHFDHYHHHHQ